MRDEPHITSRALKEFEATTDDGTLVTLRLELDSAPDVVGGTITIEPALGEPLRLDLADAAEIAHLLGHFDGLVTAHRVAFARERARKRQEERPGLRLVPDMDEVRG